MTDNIIVCINPSYEIAYEEKFHKGDITYNIALLLKEEIEKYKGFKVVITRGNEHNYPSNIDIVDTIELIRPNCLINLDMVKHPYYETDDFETKDENYNLISCYKTFLSNKELKNSILNSIEKSIKNTDFEDITVTNYDDIPHIKNGVPLNYRNFSAFSMIRKINEIQEENKIDDAYIVCLGYETCNLFHNWILNENNQKIIADNIARAIISNYSDH